MRMDTYIGDDGLLHCKNCGDPVEAFIDMPALDGTSRTIRRKVSMICKCKAEAMEEEKKRREFAEKQAKIKELQDLSLIDSKLLEANFDSYEVTNDNAKAYKVGKKYAENFESMYRSGQGILFYGDVGTGKSYTAAAISNYLIENMQPVIMTSFVKLLGDMKSFKKNDEELLRKIDVAKLLVIDDFGAERATDYALERVYNMIDSRYRSGKPLIITTNIGFSEMKQCEDMRYRRIYDRLFSMCYPVQLTGPSRRRKEAVQRFEEMNKMMEG